MTWLRLDDNFDGRPEVDALSDGAYRLHSAGLLYCARARTDGLVPAARVHRLTPNYDRGHLLELVDAGLWEAREGEGWYVPEYLETNPSAAQVAAKSAKRAEAGRAGGRASGATRRANAEPSASPVAGPVASPAGEPRPVPSRPSPPPPHHPALANASAAVVEEEEEDLEALDIVHAAAGLLAERALQARAPDQPPVVNRSRWLEVTTTERMAHYAGAALDLLGARPGIAPSALADLLEPDPCHPAAGPAPPASRDRSCADCAGSRHVFDDRLNAAVPCPTCTRGPL